jgi:hypothetical protein
MPQLGLFFQNRIIGQWAEGVQWMEPPTHSYCGQFHKGTTGLWFKLWNTKQPDHGCDSNWTLLNECIHQVISARVKRKGNEAICLHFH